MKKYKHLLVDLFYLTLSIIVAIYIFKSPIVRDFLLNNAGALTSLFAGLFFTSVLTTAPASAILGVLATKTSPWTVIFFGAAGAMIGDLVIFTFVKDRFSEDLMHFMGPSKKKFRELLHKRLFHWLTPFIGGVIIASPLPDELALFLLGITKTKTKYLIPLSYSMNALGVLLIVAVAGIFK